MTDECTTWLEQYGVSPAGSVAAVRALLRPVSVELALSVLVEHASEVVFTEDDDVIDALASRATQKPLDDVGT